MTDQDLKTYLFCYRCKVQKWYDINTSGCVDVVVDSVQCSCGVWLQ